MNGWAVATLTLCGCAACGAGGYALGTRIEHAVTLQVQADYDAYKATQVTAALATQAQYSAQLKTVEESYSHAQTTNDKLSSDMQLARERLRKSDADRAALLAAQRHSGAVSDTDELQRAELVNRTLQSASEALAYTYDQEMSRCNALRESVSAAIELSHKNATKF